MMDRYPLPNGLSSSEINKAAEEASKRNYHKSKPTTPASDDGNEREDNRIEPLRYQLKEWYNKVTKKHLVPTDCDRDNPQEVSDLITSLQAKLIDQGLDHQALLENSEEKDKRIEELEKNNKTIFDGVGDTIESLKSMKIARDYNIGVCRDLKAKLAEKKEQIVQLEHYKVNAIPLNRLLKEENAEKDKRIEALKSTCVWWENKNRAKEQKYSAKLRTTKVVVDAVRHLQVAVRNNDVDNIGYFELELRDALFVLDKEKSNGR